MRANDLRRSAHPFVAEFYMLQTNQPIKQYQIFVPFHDSAHGAGHSLVPGK